jgi:hypothetical protein
LLHEGITVPASTSKLLRADQLLSDLNSPQLPIADEPTTALDVTIQARLMELAGAGSGRVVRWRSSNAKPVILPCESFPTAARSPAIWHNPPDSRSLQTT